jgi:two-component system, NarL family, nitrate/nitrite response regulator NarL
VASRDSTRITVLVADDHPLYREAVVRAVRGRPDFQLVGEAGDGREALNAIRADCPDVAVLDVEMPSLRGVDIVDALRRDGLATRVVLLSAHLESHTVYEAVAGGVAAYLP